MNWFKRYFLNYFWLSIVLILLSILIKKSDNGIYCEVLASLFETLGMAAFVAALFNFTIETTDFIDKIKEILERIVIKKNFLNNMNEESKKEVLHNILKPTDEELKKYSNIEDYYKYYVNQTLSVSSKNVRSNYNINIKADFDKITQKIYTEGTYSYRLYPSNAGFEPITILLKEDILTTCDVIVNMPNGERKRFDFDKDIKSKFKDREDAKVATIDIKEFTEKFEHLDIELRIKEYGSDHWMFVFFKAEQPTDGFNFTLNVSEPITIKLFNVFDVGHNYHIDKTDKTLHIGCYQWINEGAGLSSIISFDEKKLQEMCLNNTPNNDEDIVDAKEK